MSHLYGYGVVRNLIDEDSRLLHTSIGSWVPGTVETELARSTEVTYGSVGTSALKVSSPGSPQAVARILGIVIPAQEQQNPLRFHVFVRLDGTEGANIQVVVQVNGPGSNTAQVDAVLSDVSGGPFFRSGQWDLLNFVTELPAGFVPSPSDSMTADITITATWPVAAVDPNMFLIHPTLCAPNAAGRNVSAAETYVRLPEYIRDADIEETDPDAPLYRFVDVLFAVGNEVDRTWADFRYVPLQDTSSRLPKLSTLADPSLANFEVIVWLAQLMGVTLVDPRVGVTAWGTLMAAADAQTFGGVPDGSPTWAEWETAIDTDDLGSDMNWDEIEDFDIEGGTIAPNVLLDFLRWQVATATYGLRAGTTESFIVSARRGLKSIAVNDGQPVPPQVVIERHADDDEWKIRVGVDEQAIIGSSLASIQELLDPAVPAGFEVEAFLLS